MIHVYEFECNLSYVTGFWATRMKCRDMATGQANLGKINNKQVSSMYVYIYLSTSQSRSPQELGHLYIFFFLMIYTRKHERKREREEGSKVNKTKGVFRDPQFFHIMPQSRLEVARKPTQVLCENLCMYG
jgi:hypothetical protein